MMALVIIVVLVASVVALAAYDRRTALDSLAEIDHDLATYRKIRQFLGIHILTEYPSLVQQDLRMRLLKQMRTYEEINDDESETRWERIWMPKIIQVIDDLAESNATHQDTEFAEAIDGFKTNERLIADAKARRAAVAGRPSLLFDAKRKGWVSDSYKDTPNVTATSETS